MCVLCVPNHQIHEDCVKDIQTGISEKVSKMQTEIESKLRENEECKVRLERSCVAIESVKAQMKEHLTQRKLELDQCFDNMLKELYKTYGGAHHHSLTVSKAETYEKTLLSLNDSIKQVAADPNLKLLCKVIKTFDQLRVHPLNPNSKIPKFKPYKGNSNLFGEIVQVQNEKPTEESGFQIFVKYMMGKCIAVFTEPFETVGELKCKISVKLGIPVDQQKLFIHVTRELEINKRPLAYYGIKHGTTLFVMRTVPQT